jgi:predicted O-methyltransferase YrrM
MHLLTRLWRSFKASVSALVYLFKSAAPISVYVCYIVTIFERIYCLKYKATQTQFRQEAVTLKLSNDWFSLHVPYWLNLFEKTDLRSKNIQALEIGSWEGLSSYFTLKTLPNAKLICVDTWEGSDEHAKQDVLNSVEQNFDANTSNYKDRLSKFKGTSYRFFENYKNPEKFDLIYVDGSHHADDVMIDALKGFQLLDTGGVMIFDDYFWQFYKQVNDNPAAAINAFLKLKKGSYQLRHVYCQLIIQKI